MNNQTKFLLTLIAFIFIVATGCQKDWEQFEPNNDVPLSELRIDPNFDWKTTKDVVITFSGSRNGVIIIKSDTDDIFHKAYLTSGNEYRAKITVPSFIKDVIITFNGKKETLSILKEDIYHSFN